MAEEVWLSKGNFRRASEDRPAQKIKGGRAAYWRGLTGRKNASMLYIAPWGNQIRGVDENSVDGCSEVQERRGGRHEIRRGGKNQGRTH